jgi:hypothetical protein
VSALAASVAHRRRRGRLCAMLVTAGGTGRDHHHQRTFLSRNRGHRGQQQDRKHLVTELMHLDHSMHKSSHEIRISDKVRLAGLSPDALVARVPQSPGKLLCGESGHDVASPAMTSKATTRDAAECAASWYSNAKLIEDAVYL